MNIISNQTEICFLDPKVLEQEKTVVFGHFTSSVEIKDYTKTKLVISANGNADITAIEVTDELEETESPIFNKDPELNLCYARSLTDLIRSEQLQCYESLYNNNIVAQIMLIEVEPLLEGFHSYLFFGFVNVKNTVVLKNHSHVFYTESGEIKTGGLAMHKTGSVITDVFSNNYSFGFGRNLKTFGQSPKAYLKNLRKYMGLLNSEDEYDKKVIKILFKMNDPSYLSFLNKLNKELEEQNMPYTPFWLNKELKEKYNKIYEKVMVDNVF